MPPPLAVVLPLAMVRSFSATVMPLSTRPELAQTSAQPVVGLRDKREIRERWVSALR
jgi:hypothetical protein